MLAFLKLLDPIEWLLIVAMAAVTAFLGIEYTRLAAVRIEYAHAQTELADLKTKYAQAAEAAEVAARAEESRRTEAARKVIEDAHTQVQEAETAARDADAARDQLQQRVAALIASARKAGGSPSAVGRSPGQQGPDAFDLLASVLSRVDEDAGQFASYADRLRVAGQACERSYDSLSK